MDTWTYYDGKILYTWVFMPGKWAEFKSENKQIISLEKDIEELKIKLDGSEKRVVLWSKSDYQAREYAHKLEYGKSALSATVGTWKNKKE